MTDTAHGSHPVKAALWMIGAIASFSSMAISGRAIGSQLDTFEIMLYRSLIGFGIVLLVARVAGTHRQIRANRLGLHLVRNIFHFAGQNLWFFSLSLITLAQVFALEFTYPIWIALAAPFILGEHLTRTRLLAALAGFFGILLIVRPGFSEMNFGMLTAILSSFGFAGSALATKLLTRDQSVTCILFWLTVMQFLLALICAGFDGDIAFPPLSIWPWVAMIAAAGLFAHFCITTALTLAPATIVMPMDFARLPVIAVVGAMFYGEALDIFVLAGGTIIFAAIFAIISSEARPKVS